MCWVRDHSGFAQVIYRIEHGEDRGQHASTKMRDADIRNKSDEELWSYLEELITRYKEKGMNALTGYLPNRIMYIGSNPMAIPPTERRS